MNSPKNQFSRILSLCLLAFGSVLFGYTIFFWPVPTTPLAAYPTQLPQHIPTVRAALPVHLMVASVIDLSVEEKPFGPNGWEVSLKGASLASSSARPGEPGNIIIYSHSLKRLFGKLFQTRLGDSIVIESQDGTVHRYTVTSTYTVSPDQIDLLKPTSTEVLTLYTCTGIFDTKRLVVRALPSL